ncbi:hypothetical protein AB0N64_06490 [Microbacterium sp. NPDC089318]
MDNDEKIPGPSDDRDHMDSATSTGAEAPTERLEEASAPATAAAANTAHETTTEADGRRRRTRSILIGTGAAVALLAFGGGAFAIGNAVADDDDDDDRTGVHAPAARGGDARGGQSGPADDRDGDRDARPDTAAASAPADAAALRAAAEAAIAHASAEGITSIEIERGGYDIDARSADGNEVELFVTPEGAVRERGDDDSNDDSEDDPLIDLAQLADLLAAAQSAADDAGATEAAFHALSTSSSGAVYEVELRAASRDEVEIVLDADLDTVRVDIDG